MNTQTPIKFFLTELAGKDQASIERVIKFSAGQGKQYGLASEPGQADIIITNASLKLDKHSAQVIRVGDKGLAPNDMVLTPPLLVSRVMRTVDEAVKRLAPRSEKVATRTQSDKIVTGDTPVASRQETKPVEGSSAEQPKLPVENPKPRAASNTERRVVKKVKEEVAIIKKEVEVESEAKTFTALVVDDSSAIRKQLELELRIAKINVDFAETGEQALEKSAHKNYDLVFLDIVMPGIDGYEVCRQMRLRESMKKTPIVMLSGKTSPLDEVQGVIAGASTYLTKPVKHELFQKTLTRLSNWLGDYAVS